MKRFNLKGVNSCLSIFGVWSTLLVSTEFAFACDPTAIQLTTLAPAGVMVPVGGKARVVGLVWCTTDENDFPDGGNNANYEIRLIDADGVVDDILGKHRDSFRRIPGQGSNFRRRVKLNFTLNCPAANPTIQGVEDSGEGAPGAGNPADLALEIDNGPNQKSDNHYPANVVGNPGAKKTIDAECVLDLGDEDQVSSASTVRENQLALAANTFQGAAEYFQMPTSIPGEIMLGDYDETAVVALWANIGTGFLRVGEQLASLNISTSPIGVDLSDTTLEAAQELLVAYVELLDKDPGAASAALRRTADALGQTAGLTGALVISDRSEIGTNLREVSDLLYGLASQLDSLASAAANISPNLANLVYQFDLQRAELTYFLNKVSARFLGSQFEATQWKLHGNGAETRILAGPGDQVSLHITGNEQYACVIRDNLHHVPSAESLLLATTNGIRPLESDPSEFQISMKSSQSGWLNILSARADIDSFSHLSAKCCKSAIRGKYNTISTPYNFLELTNHWQQGIVNVRVAIFASSVGTAPGIETELAIPAGGRLDVAVHDLLNQGTLSAKSFGVVEVSHDGPIGALSGELSYYSEGLILRESQPLNIHSCES